MKQNRKNIINKERLIREGINLISENGYHGTGLKQILDRVNIPKGSFYNYFRSKEHFVAEIIEAYSDDLINKIEAYIEKKDGTTLAKIRDIYIYASNEVLKKGENGCLLGNLAAEIGSNNSLCREALVRAFEKWKGVFTDLLKEAQLDKAIRDDIDAEDLACILWDVWEGSLLRMRVDDVDLKKNVDIIFSSLFVKG